MANRISTGRVLAGRFEADKADGIRATAVILPQYVYKDICIPDNLSLADGAFMIADRAYRVIQVDEIHAVAGSDVGAVSLDIKKQTGTQAPSAGVSVLAVTFDLKGTANTRVSKSGADLTATAADKDLAAGNRLSLDFTGTLTAVAGLCVTVKLQLI